MLTFFRHLPVLLLGGTQKVVTPVSVHAHAEIYLFHLLCEDRHSLRDVEFKDAFQRQKYAVVSGVDGAGHAVDRVRRRNASPEGRVVCEIVDAGDTMVTLLRY